MVAMAATAATPSMSITSSTSGTSILLLLLLLLRRRESRAVAAVAVSSTLLLYIVYWCGRMGCYLVCTYCTYGNVLCATLTYVVTSMIDYSHFHTISIFKIT